MLTMTTPLSDTDLMALEAAKIVDARGSACPGPLLEAKKGMGTIQVGQVMEIWSSDPSTKSDIGAWSGKVGHTFLGYLPGEGYERVFVMRQK
jgi:TusA-related sulfurtransferase